MLNLNKEHMNTTPTKLKSGMKTLCALCDTNFIIMCEKKKPTSKLKQKVEENFKQF
jgi:hypothetical protein